MKFIKKNLGYILLGAVFSISILVGKVSADLTTSQKENTVWGNLRVVFYDVGLETAGDDFDTGLTYIFACWGASDAAAASNDMRIVRNSTDGTIYATSSNSYIRGLAPGFLFIDSESSAATGRVICVGK